MVNKGEYVEPWSRQKELQKRYSFEDVPDLGELNRIITSIDICKTNKEFHNIRARALFALYYLTACRLSEVTILNERRYKQLLVHKEFNEHGEIVRRYELNKEGKRKYEQGKIPHKYIGVKKEDIRFEEIAGKKCMLIRTENRKNKLRTTKRQPIPIELEKEIVEHLERYLSIIKDSDVLFKFSPKRATQIINETGFNVHFIRHIRATHLITLYDFNEQHLIRFMGWTDSRPAKAYMELSSKDLFREFFKNQR